MKRDIDFLNGNYDKIVKLVSESYSLGEVLDKLSVVNKSSLRKRLSRYIKNNDIDNLHFTKTGETTLERWSKDNLIKAIDNSNTYTEVLENLNILPNSGSYKRLKNKLNEYDLIFNPITKISDRWSFNNMKEVVTTSKTKKEAIKKLGIRAAGGNYKQFDKYIDKYGLDISHFVVEYDIKTKIPTKDILVTDSTYNRNRLKERLYNEGLKERCCEMCGQGEEWNGKKMSLILDHINGVHDDNRLENLRIVCPNCNATLPTHAGKNNKREKKKYYCECGNEKDKKSNECMVCSKTKRRKVERPSKEELIKLIEDSNFSAIGRKYGISDNAVRKWAKAYEIDFKK